MNAVHVREVAEVLHAPPSVIPAEATRGARRFRDALRRSRVRYETLDRLLHEAVAQVRDCVAADLVQARARAGLTRRELAARVGRSAAYVARAEVGHAMVDVRYLQRVLEIGRP